MNKQSFSNYFLFLLFWMAGIEVKADVFGYDFFVNDSNGKPIYYNYIGDNSEVEVTDGLFLYSGDIVIPENVYYNNKNYKVTRIGENAFYQDDFIKSIIIPNSVKSIENYAFYKCTSLKSISFGNSLSNIGYSSFERCKSLTTIELPNTVAIIGERAFNGCSGLVNFTIPNSVTSIGYFAFDGCDNLTSIFSQMLNPVEIIGNTLGSTFSKTTYNNATLYVPEGTIGTYRARSGWRDFINIEEYNSTPVDPTPVDPTPDDPSSKQFYSNVCLYEIINDEEVKIVKGTNETYIYISEFITYNEKSYNVTSIGECAFSGCDQIYSVQFSDKLKTIGKKSFNECMSLNNLYIPNGVTLIDDSAFCNCIEIKELLINNSVVSIGDCAFMNCYNLKDVKLGNCVTSIGNRAFQNCYNTKSIIIPESVSFIGREAFAGIEMYIVYSMNKEPYDISNDAFSEYTYNNASLMVYNGSLDKYNSTEGWKLFKTIYPLSDKEYQVIMPSKDNQCGESVIWNYSEDTKTLTIYGYGDMWIYENSNKYPWSIYSDDIRYLNIEDGITYISQYSFSNLTALSNVNLPNSLTNIDIYAFYGCKNLISITIPSSVEGIGSYCFSGCSSLTTVSILSNETFLGDGVFENCNSLTSVNIPNSMTELQMYTFWGCESLTDISIPNSVTNLWNGVFGNCSGLTSISLPNSVYYIGEYAFVGCINLKSVYLPNSLFEIGSESFAGCSKLTSIIIPNSVRSIGNMAFYCENLSTVYSFVEEPFGIYRSTDSDGTFHQNTVTNGTLYVPIGTIEKYKAAYGWKDFVNIEEFDPDAINNMNISKEKVKSINGNIIIEGAMDGTPITIYSISGVEICKDVIRGGKACLYTRLKPGMMALVKIGNNNTRKVIVN